MDVTLRDGSYAVDFKFDPVTVAKVLRTLDNARVPFIEIGHGMGLQAEKAGFQSCNIDYAQWAHLANENLYRAKWGFFAQPKFSTIPALSALAENGMSFVRVGMRAEQIQNNLEYLHQAVNECEQVYLNLMKTGATPLDSLPRHLENLPSGLAGIYVVDSFGSMLPDTVHRYVQIAKEMNTEVGFHGHNNLGMANANSIAAAEAGATLLDGTLNGIGRNSGNAQIESIAAILELRHFGEYRFRTLAQLAELCRNELTPIKDSRLMEVLGGALQIHSERFTEIINIAQEFNMDISDIMSIEARSCHDFKDKPPLRKAVISDLSAQISETQN